MASKRLRQAEKELIEAKEALGTAQDRLMAANREMSDALQIKYPVRADLIFSRSKDENWREAVAVGLNDNGNDSGAARNFVYEVLNLNIGVEISERGNVTILAVDGVVLNTPIKME